ncbi:hypothetical protein [Galbibacter pacificus]|uniref:Uncharacterized protein n=1 Tax=Galbibacter pacificus TaxID=2996052 RepID=A0ABT6FNA8_9FLAO|nr:hypothetical protein [Galbibacter pacificus]MDG3581264.1 hypothetical protein [Galbibacter pacificus]MDG3584742.1 hypothetical protein [Galbibacter pacificus]
MEIKRNILILSCLFIFNISFAQESIFNQMDERNKISYEIFKKWYDIQCDYVTKNKSKLRVEDLSRVLCKNFKLDELHCISLPLFKLKKGLNESKIKRQEMRSYIDFKSSDSLNYILVYKDRELLTYFNPIINDDVDEEEIEERVFESLLIKDGGNLRLVNPVENDCYFGIIGLDPIYSLFELTSVNEVYVMNPYYTRMSIEDYLLKIIKIKNLREIIKGR